MTALFAMTIKFVITVYAKKCMNVRQMAIVQRIQTVGLLVILQHIHVYAVHLKKVVRLMPIHTIRKQVANSKRNYPV